MTTKDQTHGKVRKLNKEQKRRRSILEEKRQRISDISMRSQSHQVEESPDSTLMSEEEMKRSFDEWMKIIADNKINATNSWTLALIDYFHDLKVLKEGDSINFQKASCTLDGCVKIYTSRVDSVDSETRKLLHGLIDHQRQPTDSIEEESEEQDVQVKMAKKREHRSAATLEKDFSALDLKKFDLEFTIDPLFRKTSADFDEGGARGLLLNHLSMSPSGLIIFDSSDVSNHQANTLEHLVHPFIAFNETKVKDRFEPLMHSLDEFELCRPLQDFEFTNENQYFDPVLDFKPNASDFLLDCPSNDEPDDYEPNGFAEPFSMDEHQEEYNELQYAAVESFPMMASNQENLFSYFDAAHSKYWAGPEHWRSLPLRDRQEKPKPKKRIPKIQEHVDFTTAENAPDLDVLYATSSTNLLQSKTEKSKSLNLLPDDMHFSSKDFLKLFSNPQLFVSFRNKKTMRPIDQQGSVEAQPFTTQGDAIDAEFWAENECMPINETPQDTQPDDPFEFFDPFSDEDTPDKSVHDIVDFGDHLIDQPKKVSIVPLNFAKTAKRVDVKKLKENIWKELVDEPTVATKVHGEHKFSDIVKGLDSFYPENKRQDISVAFCFICILHLANEQGLQITGDDQLRELRIVQE